MSDNSAGLHQLLPVAASVLPTLQHTVNSFLHAAPVPLWIKDPELRYVFANPAHCALTGVSLAHLTGKTDHLWTRVDVATLFEEQDRLTLMRRSTVRTQHTLAGAPHVPQTCDVIRFPVLADNGQIFVAGMVIDMTERLQSDSQLAEANLRLQQVSSQVIEVQERERKRLAQDLHDDIGQSLTGLKMLLDNISKHGHLNQEAHEEIDNSRSLVSGVLTQIRTLSLALRPPQLDDLGLAASIRFHLERQAAAAGLGLTFTCDGLRQRLHADIENTCFRIAQEAMANVLRHAHASRVWCTLSETGAHLKMSIRDDGHGFDVDAALLLAVQGNSCGLLNIRERAELVGGHATIFSRPNEGTCLVLILPRAPALLPP